MVALSEGATGTNRNKGDKQNFSSKLCVFGGAYSQFEHRVMDTICKNRYSNICVLLEGTFNCHFWPFSTFCTIYLFGIDIPLLRGQLSNCRKYRSEVRENYHYEHVMLQLCAALSKRKLTRFSFL